MSNNFDIVLDTHPMADSVDSVSQSVKGVAASVIAMQHAVIAAEEEASKKICENVDLGFYILMSSQLSQKMALCSSQISSHLLKMQKFRGDILQIRNSMQNDYARISARYFRLFNSLDKALEQRIKALDRDAVKVSKIKSDFLLQARDESASHLLISSDAQITSQKAILAKVKDKTAKAISVLGDEVSSALSYKENMDQILMEEKTDSPSTRYIPAIIFEKESLTYSGDFIKNVTLPENATFSNINDVKNAVQNEDIDWKDMEQNENSAIRAHFEEMVQGSSLDERVAKEMIRLFSESDIQDVENSGRRER